MKPLEALEQAIGWAFMRWPYGQKQPGAVIERQSKEIRDALEKLTSDEAKNVRID